MASCIENRSVVDRVLQGLALYESRHCVFPRVRRRELSGCGKGQREIAGSSHLALILCESNGSKSVNRTSPVRRRPSMVEKT